MAPSSGNPEQKMLPFTTNGYCWCYYYTNLIANVYLKCYTLLIRYVHEHDGPGGTQQSPSAVKIGMDWTRSKSPQNKRNNFGHFLCLLLVRHHYRQCHTTQHNHWHCNRIPTSKATSLNILTYKCWYVDCSGTRRRHHSYNI